MKFRRNAPFMLIASMVIIVTAMSVLTARLFSGLTDSVEKSQFELMQSILDSNLRSAESRSLARAEMLATMPVIQEAFAQRNRERLLAECQKMFQVQKDKHGVDQAQFHLPPAVSFLRLQAPERFGDDLSGFRPLVVAVNRDQIARKGMAIARTGPAIFGVTPVYDQAGKHIGSFEFGIDFGSVLDSVKATYGFDLALFIDEAQLREVATGLNGEVYNDQNRVGKYLKFHSTNWTLIQQLATTKEMARVEEPVTYTEAVQGTTYGVLLTPIRNNSGRILGVIALAKDFSGSRKSAGRSLVLQATLCLASLILLAGIVLVVLRGFILRPLDMLELRFAALAEGNVELKVENEEAETLCEELQSLARHHETLRSRLEQSTAVAETDHTRNG